MNNVKAVWYKIKAWLFLKLAIPFGSINGFFHSRHRVALDDFRDVEDSVMKKALQENSK